MEFLSTLPNNLLLYVVVAHALFAIGLYGMLFRRTLIGFLISLELLLQGVGINIMAFGTYLVPDPMQARITTLFIIGIAAAEAAVFLGIAVAVFRNYQTIGVDELSKLKG